MDSLVSSCRRGRSETMASMVEVIALAFEALKSNW
jgi:hypothetical protein